MKNLKDNMKSYMEKDIENLEKVIDATMYNDKLLNKKTKFIQDVLEEDEKIQVVSKQDDSPDISTLTDDIAMIDSDSESWLDHISTLSQFRTLLSVT